MVVVLGETGVLPVRLTLPMSWSMLSLIAFDTLQLRVEEVPGIILLGSATKELMTGFEAPCSGSGVTSLMQLPVVILNMASDKPTKANRAYLFMTNSP